MLLNPQPPKGGYNRSGFGEGVILSEAKDLKFAL